MSWDYQARPVCYIYRTKLDEADIEEGRNNADIEVVFPYAEDEDYSEVQIDISHYDDSMDSFLYGHIHLPIHELARLHIQIGNMLDYAKEKNG